MHEQHFEEDLARRARIFAQICAEAGFSGTAEALNELATEITATNRRHVDPEDSDPLQA